MFEVQGSAGAERQVMAALLVKRDSNYECHQGCDIRNFQPTEKICERFCLRVGWWLATCRVEKWKHDFFSE